MKTKASKTKRKTPKKARVRVVPAKELTIKNLSSSHYVRALTRWAVRKKSDRTNQILFTLEALTWFAAREEACRETGLDKDQIDVRLADGEKSLHDHNDDGLLIPKPPNRKKA